MLAHSALFRTQFVTITVVKNGQLYFYAEQIVFLSSLFRRSEPDVPTGSESGVLVSQTSADLGSVSGGQ